jgi:hypothetical protein
MSQLEHAPFEANRSFAFAGARVGRSPDLCAGQQCP